MFPAARQSRYKQGMQPPGGFAPQAAPVQRPPGRIEVKVSYGARLGCAYAAAALFLLLTLYGIVTMALAEPPKTDPMAAGGSCFDGMIGTKLCHDSTSAGTKDYDWSAATPGTYTFTVKSAPGLRAGRTIRVRNAGFTNVAEKAGTAGRDTVVSANLPAGKYSIGVTDDPKPPGGYPFVLSIVKQGEAPPKPASAEPPFPLGLLAIPALGLVFLVIPVVLVAEKRRIPRYIDPSGVTMRNGAQHAWSELRGVRPITQRLRSGMFIDRGVELVFARGSAQLIYRPITNAQEVLWIVPALQAGQNPWG